jgi:hypothetical protein
MMLLIPEPPPWCVTLLQKSYSFFLDTPSSFSPLRLLLKGFLSLLLGFMRWVCQSLDYLVILFFFYSRRRPLT